MHNVPTLSHGTPLTNNQGNKPTEQGIKTPQQQRHHQNHRNNDQSRLRGLLAGWPNNLANLNAGLFQQNRESLTTNSLQRYKRSNTTQNDQPQNTVEDRLSGEVLITDNTHNNQGSDNQPLDQIKARVFGFSLNIHSRGSCERRARFVRKWQVRRESNPQPAVLETAALPIELLT